jgi:hypothetical protein
MAAFCFVMPFSLVGVNDVSEVRAASVIRVIVLAAVRTSNPTWNVLGCYNTTEAGKIEKICR